MVTSIPYQGILKTVKAFGTKATISKILLIFIQLISGAKATFSRIDKLKGAAFSLN
ncbi:hypothetical protein [Chroococcidiopsis sp. TS-821]|uniref:hypothetical protein n=1 Tax=Chroococcidiopsis sp. TS-821 TaxID=1378066 RepID=UPI00143CD8A0|nr:hypothetical protein [Chroococcidiopsis sp. TS-821]